MTSIKVNSRIFFPILACCWLAISTDGTYNLMNLSVEIDVYTYGIGNTPIIFGNIFTLGKFLFNLIVLGQVLHNAHLGRFFRLDEAVFVSPCQLGKSLRGDYPQIVIVIEKTSVHVVLILV